MDLQKISRAGQDILAITWRGLKPTLGKETGAAPVDLIRTAANRMKQEATTRATPREAKLQWAIEKALQEYDGESAELADSFKPKEQTP